MKIFTRILLSKKNVKVNEIPKDLLTSKSQNVQIERNFKDVSFYYVNNGDKLLSVLNDDNNNAMEVVEILNSLDSIFHVNFDNLFIRKSDKKLLGFTYPLIYNKDEPKVNMDKLATIITDSNDPQDLKEILRLKNDYTKNEARSIIANTIFWYKILKYLNSQKISVKNLSFNDIISYNDTYTSKYIYIINAISKLDILESDSIEEEIEIVNLCLKYFSDVSKKDVFSSEFNKFLVEFEENYKLYKDGTLKDLSFFENMNFLDVFYSKFKGIITSDFNNNHHHEYDKFYLRCPICNSEDSILTQKECNKLTQTSNLIFEDSDISVYNSNSKSYIVIKDIDKKIESIKRFINFVSESLNHCIIKYNYVYDENSKLFALEVCSSKSYTTFNNISDYVESILDDLNNGGIGSFKNFCCFFSDLYYQMRCLYLEGLKLDISNDLSYKEVLDCFWRVNNVGSSYQKLEIKPSKLALGGNRFLDVDNVEEKRRIKYVEKILANVVFNVIKEKSNFKIENDKIVSDTDFDIVNCFNLRFVVEYKKFLKKQEYNPHVVRECLDSSNTFLTDIPYSSGEFDSSYVVSPKEIKSVLEEEISQRDLITQYEFCKKPIKNLAELMELVNVKDLDIVIPEYIVYTAKNEVVQYKGYWIKKQKSVPAHKAFSSNMLENKTNKEIMQMVLTYYKYVNANKKSTMNIPVEFLCFDLDYSRMFIRYCTNKNRKGTINEYFSKNVLTILKDSQMYFSDMIPIIESAPICKKVELEITEIFESFTNYCSVHNCWYENSLTKCPICSKYYEYIDIEKISSNKTVLYENDLYKIISYKSRLQLKLYKFADENTLVNGKTVRKLESEILSLLKGQIALNNAQKILKLVKDSNSEKVIGVLIPQNEDNMKSVYEVISDTSTTNLTIIEILYDLLSCFNDIYFTFSNLETNSKDELEEFLKYNLFYSKDNDSIYVSDYEFLADLRISSSYADLNQISNLDKVIKYIIYNNRKCYDLRNITFPEIDYNYMQKLSEIFEELRYYYTELAVRLCHKHSVYYNTVDGMCPLCMEEKDEVCILAPEEKGKEVNFGGEAFIYSLGRTNLIKAYKKSKIKSSNEELTEEIQKALDEEDKKKNERRKNVLEIIKPLYASTKKDLENKNFIIPFPKKLVYAGMQKKFMGFLQDKVPDTITFYLFTNTKICNELGFTTNLSLLDILIGYGDGIEYLHNSKLIREVTPDGIVLGDVSGRNVLYSKYLKKVAIIDMDSVGISGYPACTLTDEYSDPLTVKGNTIIKQFSFESDWYSFAIICFYILTKVHPFDGVYDNSYEISIVERKEKKISVLGKYKDNITLPNVVVNWDWMPDYLLNAFVDIFENEKRYSILHLLKKAYNEISGVQKYSLDTTNDVIVEKVVEKKRPIKVGKKIATKNNGMKVEILANLNGNLLGKESSDLIMIDSKVYYKRCFEKMAICDEKLNCKALNYQSEIDLINNAYQYFFDELHVRDGKGIATIIEGSEKFIGLVEGNEFTKIYRISDVNRKFVILSDILNDRYLLISDTKSYVISSDKTICNYYDVYNTSLSQIMDNFNKTDFEKQVAYVGNAIYFAEDGYICRLDLNSGKQVKIDCPLATKKSSVKVFSDAIVVVTEKEILKLVMQK